MLKPNLLRAIERALPHLGRHADVLIGAERVVVVVVDKFALQSEARDQRQHDGCRGPVVRVVEVAVDIDRYAIMGVGNDAGCRGAGIGRDARPLRQQDCPQGHQTNPKTPHPSPRSPSAHAPG